MPNRIEWERDDQGNVHSPSVVFDQLEVIECPKCGCARIYYEKEIEATWYETGELIDGEVVMHSKKKTAHREFPIKHRYRCTNLSCEHVFQRKWEKRS